MMYASQAVMSIERIYFATWLLPRERVCFKKKKKKEQKHPVSIGFATSL